MRLVPSRDDQILTLLRDCLAESTEALFATAFASTTGAELLRPELELFLGRAGTLDFYATLDGGAFTQPGFCKILLELTERYDGRVKVYLYPHASSLFHAKVFLFRRRDGEWLGVVGSANLTGRALTSGNFEVVAVGDPLAIAEVERFRTELSLLRTSGAFHALTRASLAAMLGANAAGDDDDPEAREHAQRAARNRRARVEQVLSSAPPARLPPLPLLAIPPAGYVESVCATGVAVATDDDLADLSVGLDLGMFIRGGLLPKEATKKISFVSEKTKKGHSFSLIDDAVRAQVSKARRAVGLILGHRSVDFGYLRWLPRPLYADALAAIGERGEVQDAQQAVHPGNAAHRAHLATLDKEFRSGLRRVVAGLALRDRKHWERWALEKLGLASTASVDAVNKEILNHLVRSYQSRLSLPLVQSQLGRMTFQPRQFAFPLSQTLGSDEQYGHKAFLAALVFAWTDRKLRRTTESDGKGAVFDYLDARIRLNESRHGLESARLAERAASWLEPVVTLATAVGHFQQIVGAETFTWDKGDLVTSLPTAARSA